jgi:demethylmenaquinone methyltransferase/2-methoxy-6-polyprenyl-1,4-benzoquinol methylase
VNPPKGAREFVVLDLAGGTGDVAFRIAQAGGPGTRIVVCDINPDMLAVGQERAAERDLDGVVTFEQGNAEELAYPDRSFDCVTIAFGIRNVPRIERALAQAHRVLKLGGRFLCLEFSSVDVPGLDALYELYSFQVIPRIGDAVAGDRDAYQYLVESIRKFPKPKLFATMIEASGFRRASFTPMTGGVVALHSGWRL